MLKKLGKYTILEKLGEGSMGTVYKAHDTILDRNVAVKIMADEIQRNPELKLRFYREAKAAAGLHHQNIVTIHDLGEEGDLTYIVMELLDGRNLKDIIRDKIPLPLEKKLSIMCQVADALSCAHEKGVIHRDIKPGNIFVTENETVKILDFGIARLPLSDLTRTGQRLGTPVYMAPEQVRGAKSDERSDIFSTGIVFYELLTNFHPFRDKDLSKAMENILFQKQLPFNEQFPDSPAGLWPILNTCLAKDPSARFSSMSELGQYCRRLLDEVNAVSRQMADELRASLPGLQNASERPDAPSGLVRLCQHIRDLLNRGSRPDYLSLVHLKSELSAAQHAHQAPAEAKTGKSSVSAESPLQAAAKQPAKNEPGFPKPQEPPAPPSPIPPQGPSEDEVRGNQMLSEAQALLAQDQLDQAIGCMRSAIGLLGPKEALVQMLVDTRKKIEKRNRAQVSRLFESARAAMVAKEYANAILDLDQILELEPESSEAKEMRRSTIAEIDAQKTRQAKRDEGEREKASGFKLLAEKKFRESLQAFQRAAELLGEDTATRLGKDEAEKGLREEELQSRILTGMAEAQRLFRSRLLDQARLRATEVLELSPRNAEAAELLARIDHAREEKDRKDTLSSLLKESEDALNRKAFDKALSSANQALQRDPANAEVQAFIRQISEAKERNRRQQEVSALCVKAEECLGRRELNEAGALILEALAINPEDASVLGYAKRIDRARQEKAEADRIASLISQGLKELSSKNFRQAQHYADEVLQLNAQNAAAAKLLADIREAEQDFRSVRIADLLSRARTALGQDDFSRARDLANEILALDAKHKDAKSLLKESKNAARRKEREEKKKSRESVRETAFEKTSAVEETIILRKQEKKIPWMWIAAVAGIVVIGAFALFLAGPHRQEKREKQVDYSAQLTSAKNNLDQRMYDKAIEIAQGILASSPGNAQAKTILDQAQKSKNQANVELLMMEAQFERSQNQFEESLKTITKVLEIIPNYQPALAVRAQIEAEMSGVKVKAEQDEAVRKQLGNIQSLLAACKTKEARTEVEMVKAGKSDLQKGFASARALLAGCKLDQAKTEIEKIAASSPDALGLLYLRKRLAARMTEVAGIREEMDSHAEAAQRQDKRAAELNRARELFRQGKYSDTVQLISESPLSGQLEELRSKAEAALSAIRGFETAVAARQPANANQAWAALREVNPEDPNLQDFRRQIASLQTSGKAVLNIYRLNEPATVLLDEQPIGADGEVSSFDIKPGPHKIAVRNSSGKQGSLTNDFADGQNFSFAYDAAVPELHLMTEADRAIRNRYRQLQDVHRFTVEHLHGLLRGSCSGELMISGFRVDYRPRQGNHGFSTPFSSLKIKLNDGKIELLESGQSKAQVLKAPGAETKKIKELWDTLEKLGK